MPTTSNFGWTTPADTDLVKDGAAAIRTLGNGIDTSLVDLKGGTTGQILSKASNTDLDYTWITNDVGDITNVAVTAPVTGGGSSGSVTIGIQDGTTTQKGAVQLENSTSSTSTTTAAVPESVKSAYDLANAAIPKSLVDAAGDLIYATANDTVTRLALGTASQVLTVNSGATAPEWAIGGGYTQLASGTLSGSSLTLSSISGSYRDLVVLFKAVIPATDSATGVMMQINADSTSNRHTSLIPGSNSAQSFNNNYWLVYPPADNAVGTGFSVVTIFDYANTTTWKTAFSNSVTQNQTTTTNFNFQNQYHIYNQTGAVTSLYLVPGTGNWTSGSYVLYGVK